MFIDYLSPKVLSPQEFDYYLANGWFRMGQDIFTTNFLKFQGGFYPAVWLRIDLNSEEVSNTQKKILKQNKHLKTLIQPFVNTNSKENLFTSYRKDLKFSPAPSLQTLLFRSANEQNTVFNTYDVCVYDENKLIAAGVFDLGEKSAEGITCFYDHSYRKYSLGKYLMYLKMDFCKNLGYDYFYPGYFAPGYSFFDYKLDLRKNALEYFDFVEQTWLPFSKFDNKNTPFALMETKLHQMANLLQVFDIKAFVKMYEFFDIGLNDIFRGEKLVEYPIFLYIPRLNPFRIHVNLIIFNPLLKQYQFAICSKEFEFLNESDEEEEPDYSRPIYDDFILNIQRIVYSSDTAEELAGLIRTLLDENLLI